MIIELRNIHARWKLLIENTCRLLVSENKTVWNVTDFGMRGCVTNKGKSNSMEGRDVAKLNGRETEIAKPALPITGLVSFASPILPMDPFYLLHPAVCIQILRRWKR
jgi:hypothetical protein